MNTSTLKLHSRVMRNGKVFRLYYHNDRDFLISYGKENEIIAWLQYAEYSDTYQLIMIGDSIVVSYRKTTTESIERLVEYMESKS